MTPVYTFRSCPISGNSGIEGWKITDHDGRGRHGALQVIPNARDICLLWGMLFCYFWEEQPFCHWFWPIQAAAFLNHILSFPK